MKRGVTLIEVLISIGIIAVLSVIAIWHWSQYRNSESLNKEKISIISMFEEARSLAVSSRTNSSYGVHIASSTITTFQGTSYPAGASTNIDYSINSSVQVYSINLNPSGADVVFDRLYGTTQNTGAIKLILTSNQNSSTTITVLSSGVVQ